MVHCVFSCWVYFIHQVEQCDESLCNEAICASWKVVQALSTNPHDFWSTLQGFVRLAFHPGLLQLTEEQNPRITACIQQVREKPERPLAPFVIKKTFSLVYIYIKIFLVFGRLWVRSWNWLRSDQECLMFWSSTVARLGFPLGQSNQMLCLVRLSYTSTSWLRPVCTAQCSEETKGECAHKKKQMLKTIFVYKLLKLYIYIFIYLFRYLIFLFLCY